MIKKYEYSEPNKCICRNSRSRCTRSALWDRYCPEIIQYNSDNSNNVLCDLAGYKEKTDMTEE